MPRITIACPDAHRDNANQLAAALGFSMADVSTYGPANWQDNQGNLYACASVDVSDDWLAAAQQPLQRPQWDSEQQINITGAQQAQQLIALWYYGTEGSLPAARTDKLNVIVGCSGVEALGLMGIQPIVTD